MGTTTAPTGTTTFAPPLPAFRVAADGLNLRSAPRAGASTRLAVLHRDTRVQRVSGGRNDAWWEVDAPVGARVVRGFVAARFLKPEADFAPPPSSVAVRAVHLAEDRITVTRDSVGGAYAFPLGERGRPARAGDTPAERARSLRAIVRWLAVDRSRRYRRVGATTYCNIYATDFCYLAGAYLPRVWWTGKSLERLARGEPVTPTLGLTVQEMTANQLLGWLAERGDDFGWRRIVEMEEVQHAVNDGAVGVVCAQRADLNRPGHIAVIVPEDRGHRAPRRRDGTVAAPLLSQAGATNFRFGGTPPGFWTSPKFRDFGFWVHA